MTGAEMAEFWALSVANRAKVGGPEIAVGGARGAPGETSIVTRKCKRAHRQEPTNRLVAGRPLPATPGARLLNARFTAGLRERTRQTPGGRQRPPIEDAALAMSVALEGVRDGGISAPPSAQ